MSNNVNRYRNIYNKAVRPNSVTPFPKHVFMRSQNKIQTKAERLGDRKHCFDSTFVHLTERFNDTELFLVGTMNTSTMLARRTQKLIRDIKPDAVMVMASPGWWNTARLIKDVNSQDEFEKYQSKFLLFIRFLTVNLVTPFAAAASFIVLYRIPSPITAFALG